MVAGLVAAVCAVAWLHAQGAGATMPRRGGNPVAAQVENPVPSTETSMEAGRALYVEHCAHCHGGSGRGDGGGASGGGQPADFTDDQWEFGSSDGEIFSVIAEGTSTDMQAYAGRIPVTGMWNLVNFLRTLKH